MRIITILSVLCAAMTFTAVWQTASAFDWTPQSDCASCHERYTASMNDQTLLAGKHAAKGITNCSDCHADQGSLKASHSTVTGSKRIMMLHRYPQEFCFKCHGSLAQLAQETAKSQALKDIKGKVINPHAIPDTPGHKGIQDCSNCHRMHRPNKDAASFCYGCHHKMIFECKSCHTNDGKINAQEQK